ncbi:hypothetical protein ACL02T_25580 [Pseudonocardia sp. RS010]|uniref:hypothetical protein n=1 Tax=Pseudonocardia sp. RS010 TaxID=3385979 RepID=UPI0039A21106
MSCAATAVRPAADFYRFSTVQLLDAELRANAAAMKVAEVSDRAAGRCGEAENVAGTWSGPDGAEQGLLLCRVDSTGAALYWTDRAALGYGVLRDPKGDLRALQGRWRRMALTPPNPGALGNGSTEGQTALLTDIPPAFGMLTREDRDGVALEEWWSRSAIAAGG